MAKRQIHITKAKLKRATDSRSWERGENYFRQGRVGPLLTDGQTLMAKVSGRRNYQVRLWAQDNQVDGECSCPMGDAGVFCKHCVAVGLEYLNQGADNVDADGLTSLARMQLAKPAVSLDDLREYLAKQNKADLVEMLMDQLTQDDRLRESLLMKVALHGPGGLDLATYRQAIDSATDAGPGGFVDYGESYDFVRRIESVVESISELLEEGYPAEVIDLTEYALASCENALGYMDDSDGSMSAPMERLGEIHHAACRAAKPDPEVLARRLFKWELQTDWDTFYGAAERYADVLGEKGLAVYRKLAEELWSKTPQLSAGDREGRYEGHRFRLTSIMESLARADGDLEALVSIKSRDLSYPYHYLEIAEIYKKARKPAKTLEWAERGMKDFPNHPDSRLVDFLAEEYHRRKRHDEAMALIWNRFVRSSGLSAYQDLCKHAKRIRQWPTWRGKALEYLQAIIGKQTRPKQQGRWDHQSKRDHSTLVEIYLWEKDVETAWTQAQTGGCSDSLWMRLAELREKDHPADTLPIYQAQINPIVQQKSKPAYREATALIRKIKKLMTRLGQEAQFAKYLAAVRQAHKPKRNFMAMLARVK
ncbi:MAG: hypothetical protein GWP14_02925 [Actinobacteria bacterium]|nr:hypothetical protein [Actinomycetota bacterium]